MSGDVDDRDEPSIKARPDADQIWLQQVRDGDDDAWQMLIDQFEGRLLAFATARVNDRVTAEDIVQEAFVGFYRSLPNFDGSRSIEAYLYQICSYKITDHLRRHGQRKLLSFDSSTNNQSSGRRFEPHANLRMASSIMRSQERTQMEHKAIAEVLRDQVGKWIAKQDYQKLKCIELLVVVGAANKDVASKLGITEQQVANYKADFLSRTRTLLSRLNLSQEIFPDLF
jgi:RNA polymerase sigma-70 factor (ECF subfamily)